MRIHCGLLTVSILAFVVTGCSTPSLSESMYRSGEVGKSKTVERCRVIEVRQVLIRDEQGDAETGGLFGAILGGIIGGTAASAIGGGTGSQIATQVGAGVGVVTGSVAGTKLSDKMSERVGVEYSIIKSNGEESTHVQELLPTDRVLAVGDTCRVQIDFDGKNRVLPAEHLPDAIAAPKTTTVVPLAR